MLNDDSIENGKKEITTIAATAIGLISIIT